MIKITGILRLGELDQATEPIYLHLFDTKNNAVSAPLALVNEIKLPGGISHSFGFDAPTSSKYIRNKLYINQDSFKAQAGEIVQDMSLWVRGNRKNRTVLAIYENTDDDWKTATKVYETTREPEPVEHSLEVSQNGAKNECSAFIALNCREILLAGTAAQLFQGDGDLPTEMSERINTITEQN